LKNEQDALTGMQMKLKDLRTEFNNEKIQSNAALKMHMEQLQASRAEIKGLNSEMQFLNEKHNSEKQALSMSFKQLQQKYMQVSESLKTFENLPNIQQIQNENQMLQKEIIAKNQQIVELKGRADENRQLDVS
jgi:chromosome segregation ATPase